MNTTKGQTVTINATGKIGTIAGKSRNGSLLIQFADGTQARVWDDRVTPA